MRTSKHIHLARRKMGRVLDELYTALLLAGSTHMELTVDREAEGFRLSLGSDFAPEHYDEIRHLTELLQPAVKNPALVEEFWELAGGDRYTSDSELVLVGQMVDEAAAQLTETQLTLSLYIAF